MESNMNYSRKHMFTNTIKRFEREYRIGDSTGGGTGC